jgi:glycosyltransferase involved in cell wall biosynthesis
MNGAKLVVVTTMYNSAPHLPEAITSILEQTYKDFVYLLIDDGSIDDTVQIAQEFAKCDPRISLIRIKHSGIAEAANVGCRQAAAEYVARLDADDIAIGDRLERQLYLLEKRKDVAMIGGGMQPISRDGVRLNAHHYPTSAEHIRTRLKAGNCICHSTVMMRRQIMQRVGWYRPFFEPSEDYDLWLRISEVSDIVNLPRILVLYRIHDKQASFRMIEQQALGALAARLSQSLRVKGLQDVSHGSEHLASIELIKAAGINELEIVREILNHYDQAIKVAKELEEKRVAQVRPALLHLITRREEVATLWDGLNLCNLIPSSRGPSGQAARGVSDAKR